MPVLVERDPVGVGFYGDISGFTRDEKHALLASLHRETSRLGSLWGEAAAFAGLATPDMEPEIRKVLTDPDRSDEHEGLTMFLLRVLRAAAPLPWLSEDLSGVLLGIVRDNSRREGPKWFALDAHIHTRQNSKEEAGAALASCWRTSTRDVSLTLTASSSGNCCPVSTPSGLPRRGCGTTCGRCPRQNSSAHTTDSGIVTCWKTPRMGRSPSCSTA